MIDFDQLTALHETKRLRLVTTIGQQGFVVLDDDPEAMVRELLRLARFGQQAEAGLGLAGAISISSNWEHARS